MIPDGADSRQGRGRLRRTSPWRRTRAGNALTRPASTRMLPCRGATMLSPSDFFDLDGLVHGDLFDDCSFVWDALADLDDYLAALLENARGAGKLVHGDVHPGAVVEPEGVVVATGAIIETGAYVSGPTVVGPGTVVRHGAYVRPGSLIGADCVVGHATEVKHSVLLDGAKAPHFAYVGDSILGRGVNLGAGTKLSNVAVNVSRDPETGLRPTIVVEADGASYDTGLDKLGAILGDRAQTGCNVVTNPGCLIGPRTQVYANVSVRRGTYPPDHIVKLRQDIDVVGRTDTPPKGP